MTTQQIPLNVRPVDKPRTRLATVAVENLSRGCRRWNCIMGEDIPILGRRWIGLAWVVLVWLIAAPAGFAQIELNPLGGGFGTPGATGNEFTMSTRFELDEGTRTGRLIVQVKLEGGWHIYSTTQPPGGPLPTKFKMVESPDYRLTGPFDADRDPHIDDPDPVFNIRVESFDEVVWTAPLELSEGVDPANLKIEFTLNGQRCVEGSCLPIKQKATATFSGYRAAARADTIFTDSAGHVSAKGEIQRPAVGTTDPLKVVLTLTPAEQVSLPVWAAQPAATGAADVPTLVVFTKLGALKERGEPQVEGTVAPGSHPSTYSGPVQITYSFDAPAEQLSGDLVIRGAIGYRPQLASGTAAAAALEFSGNVPGAGGEVAPVQFQVGSSYEKVAEQLVQYQASRRGGGAWKDYPAGLVMFWAFLAGAILNIMPCVLPVIGIKIMSFVNQAGAHPGRLIALNIVFSLGIIAVFLALATLAVFFGFGWGDLYKNAVFTIVMVSVLFVFALSFVGVWEIPLPGFVGTAGGAMQKQEGFSAAFVKGVFTTLLATPCSGPMLVPAVVWAIAQPVWITYLVFASMGLGMASPYLIVSIFPGFAKTLPRPGDWMVTFKILMGFLLLGAVVFFYQSVTKKYQTSTLAFLVFLGMACWLVGSVSVVAEFKDKFWAWTKAAGVVLVGAFVSFFMLIPQYELEWEPYSKSALEKHLAAGRAVFVDATADWCFTCKTNEFTSFNRKVTYDFFRKHEIVALKADNTNESAEINEFLDGFGNTAHGLPYYALYHPKLEEPRHFGSQTFLGPQDFLKTIEDVFIGTPGTAPANEGAATVSSGSASGTPVGGS